MTSDLVIRARQVVTAASGMRIEVKKTSLLLLQRRDELRQERVLHHVGEIAVFGDQEADQAAEGDRERERGQDLARSGCEIVAHACPLQQLAERR